MAPTRELAAQIHAECDKFAAAAGLAAKGACAVVYGGTPLSAQQRQLEQEQPLVVVATPGRLCDLMGRRSIDLGKATYASYEHHRNTSILTSLRPCCRCIDDDKQQQHPLNNKSLHVSAPKENAS